MMTNWTITPGAPTIALDGARHAAATFTVTNNGAEPDRVVVDLVVDDPTTRGWLVLADPQRFVAPGASVTFQVEVSVPADAPAGRHWLVGRAYSAETAPEESSTLSDRVTYEVPAAVAPRTRNWWPILAAAALAVSVLAVVLAVVLGGKAGPVGPSGPAGAKGDPGSSGQPATAAELAHQVVVVTQPAGPNSADYYSSTQVLAACPAGKHVLGGGYDIGSISTGVVVSRSRPNAEGTSWELWVHNGTPNSVNATAYAICGQT